MYNGLHQKECLTITVIFRNKHVLKQLFPLQWITLPV